MKLLALSRDLRLLTTTEAEIRPEKRVNVASVVISQCAVMIPPVNGAGRRSARVVSSKAAETPPSIAAAEETAAVGMAAVLRRPIHASSLVRVLLAWSAA